MMPWCASGGGLPGRGLSPSWPRAQSLSTPHPQAPGPITDHGLRDFPGQTQASLPEEVAQLAATPARQEMGAASDALYMQMTKRSHP